MITAIKAKKLSEKAKLKKEKQEKKEKKLEIRLAYRVIKRKSKQGRTSFRWRSIYQETVKALEEKGYTVSIAPNEIGFDEIGLNEIGLNEYIISWE